MSPGPLAGVRVLDFGRYIAGPFCAALLGDFGADVIRVERLSGGEDRFPFPVAACGGACFLQMNRNKRGMTLNPAKPAARGDAGKGSHCCRATLDRHKVRLSQPSHDQSQN